MAQDQESLLSNDASPELVGAIAANGPNRLAAIGFWLSVVGFFSVPTFYETASLNSAHDSSALARSVTGVVMSVTEVTAFLSFVGIVVCVRANRRRPSRLACWGAVVGMFGVCFVPFSMLLFALLDRLWHLFQH
jgi:hypothetical protein